MLNLFILHEKTISEGETAQYWQVLRRPGVHLCLVSDALDEGMILRLSPGTCSDAATTGSSATVTWVFSDKLAMEK